MSENEILLRHPSDPNPPTDLYPFVASAHFVRPGDSLVVLPHFQFWDDYGHHWIEIKDGKAYVCSEPNRV